MKTQRAILLINFISQLKKCPCAKCDKEIEFIKKELNEIYPEYVTHV
jgi:hypothetical protein|tara:strand:- start:16753 stop:16893 length:141 start_codon:yes stop_codon:yes gene_type:complete